MLYMSYYIKNYPSILLLYETVVTAQKIKKELENLYM